MMPESLMQLIDKLDACDHLRSSNRWARLLRLPVRMGLPKLLQHAGTTRPIYTQTFFGTPMRVVLPEAVSIEIYRYSYFERELSKFMLDALKPGQSFVDVGSHFGFFSLLARHIVGHEGRVVAFEPTPSTYAVTRENLGRWNNTEVHNKAVWCERTTIAIKDFGVNLSAYNSIFGAREDERTAGKAAQQVTNVEAIDLDSELASLQIVPHFIKIDAESAERQVLQGATQTLRTHRPFVSLELGDFDVPGACPSHELVETLIKLDYVPIEADDRGGYRRHHPADRYGYENLFFVDRDKLDHFV